MTDQRRKRPTLPDKPTDKGLEAVWAPRWDAEGTYRFDRSKSRADVYAIDTPPPTVSGSLHVGHVFSYTHTDIIARYKRMTGKSVFYPIGWDDNGLPTERRVQNVYGVRCDPSLPYDADFVPPEKPGKREIPISRRNFTELCDKLTAIDEKAFEDLWRRVGISVDWSLLYTTISAQSRRISQMAFLRNIARGEAYQSEAPTLWDVTFQTAVAQAELEDRDADGAYHRISFHAGDEPVWIDTTRPELLPACVALVAHPDDERYKHLFGSTVRTPLFGVEVPVKPHHLAEPDKGTGIAMVCTFGDLTDVIWWRELALETRPVIGRDGRLLQEPPAGVGDDPYKELAGKTVFSAKERIVELLQESGEMDGDPRPVRRPVKFYERGQKPLEIVTARQWYIRNGGRDLDLRQDLLEAGRKLSWHPPHMQVRYENWVEGLAGDWLISRQRFFGVPIPVWYRLDSEGETLYDEVLTPAEDMLPVDPAADTPPGFTEDQRDQPNGFRADPDVMDTWATSSLTPQIAANWGGEEDLYDKVFPMDLRPQSHEIIRTWLFSTLTRAHLETGKLPWEHVGISGWILDPDRKKMSKSKGNVVTPADTLDEFGSDAVRYWSANGRYGVDTAFDRGQLKVGHRLVVKILNASKFVLSLDQVEGEITHPVDLSLLAMLDETVKAATQALEKYDHAGAIEAVERFFWMFCGDYLELVKDRAYQSGPDAGSAQSTLRTALDALLRMFAPFVPFVTEEVWSWWQEGSVHAAPWPQSSPVDGDPAVLTAAASVLTQVRKAKSEAKLSMKADVAKTVVTGREAGLAASAADDLRSAGHIADLTFDSESDGDLQAEVTLA